ncbi:unnamed protein product [Linum tenue]|uniref:Cytochrome P450 n=1 Tax=Linum tenue TaxID=586396 RepID=A0AAV0L3Z6_9ROSI|nr:unnamed protein product [Linum tenue]
MIGNKNFEYAPFGKGRRACPGVPMANQVMHLTLATLLQGFLLTVPGDDGHVDMTEHYTLALQKATPLQVQILPRLLPHLYPSME